MSDALTSAITTFLETTPDLSTVSFPSAFSVCQNMLKKQGATEGSINGLKEDSPMVSQVNLQIEVVKSNLNTIINQLPLLSIPVSIPIALGVIKSLLPSTLKIITDLGLEPPEALLPILGAMNSAQSILSTAASVLVGPLEPLKQILGIE